MSTTRLSITIVNCSTRDLLRALAVQCGRAGLQTHATSGANPIRTTCGEAAWA